MAPQVGISDTLRFGSSSSFNHGQKSTVQIQLEEERSKRLKICFAMIVNFIASISLILLNKYLFKIWKIHAINLVCFHLLCTTVCNLITKAFGCFHLPKKSADRWESAKKVFPLSAFFCGFVVLTNLSLETNTVGTYQILKCLSDPVLLMIQMYIFRKIFRMPIKIAMVTIFIGVSINSAYDLSFSFLGLVYGLSGAIFCAFYTIYVGKKQEELNLNNMQLIYYQAPISCCILFLLILSIRIFASAASMSELQPPETDLSSVPETGMFLEARSLDNLTDISSVTESLIGHPRVRVSRSQEILTVVSPIYTMQNLYSDLQDNSKISLLLLTGFSAYLVNISSYWIIGNSSILTYCVFAKVKLCATIVAGVLFFHDIILIRQALGMLVTLSGVCYYAYEKYLEKIKMQRRKDSEILKKEAFDGTILPGSSRDNQVNIVSEVRN